jgi:3-hydroxybutyryl-CoA dehydrogenase
MVIAILADDVQKQELLAKKFPGDVTVIWADSVRALTMVEADVFIDLLFEPDAERTAQLKKLLPQPVLVNSVPWVTKTIGAPFIRINGWPTLLQRPVIEIALPDAVQETDVKAVFDKLQWQYQVVPDIAGMITPRVLAMIINEAYYTLGAEVSSKQEIDIAMKLGTSYPYGPFEWSEKIGLQYVYTLLHELNNKDQRYAVAPLLKGEADMQ